MKKIIVNDIAIVNSGVFIRPEKVKEGNISYLQARHFDDYGELREKLELILWDVNERHILKKWDILFSSKWTRMYTAMYKEEFWKCVASSSFYVIRLQEKKYLPEYISIYINSVVNTKNFQANYVTGNSIKMVKKWALLWIKIPDISIEKQKKVVDINNEIIKQKWILVKLIEKKSQFLENVILNSK
jgi:hypothetical protein